MDFRLIAAILGVLVVYLTLLGGFVGILSVRSGPVEWLVGLWVFFWIVLYPYGGRKK